VLKLRAQQFVRLSGGRTIRQKLNDLDRQMALERDCSVAIRTDLDRAAYEEKVGRIDRAVAVYDEMVRLLIENGLRDGSLFAVGLANPDAAPRQIPTRYWHFLELDYERACATAPAHDLVFHGVQIGLQDNYQQIMSGLGLGDASLVEDGFFWHSPDYHEVRLNGELFKFPGSKQRKVVQLLHEAAKSDDPWQYGLALLGEVGSNDSSNRLGNLFSKNPAWGRLIISDLKGYYRLEMGGEKGRAGSSNVTS
jgi:hypothetical protein